MSHIIWSTALSSRPLRLSLTGIKVSNTMSCQSDEITSLLVKRHYKNSEYIHYFFGNC